MASVLELQDASLGSSRKWWWNKWLSNGIPSGQAWFESQVRLKLLSSELRSIYSHWVSGFF